VATGRRLGVGRRGAKGRRLVASRARGRRAEGRGSRPEEHPGSTIPSTARASTTRTRRLHRSTGEGARPRFPESKPAARADSRPAAVPRVLVHLRAGALPPVPDRPPAAVPRVAVLPAEAHPRPPATGSPRRPRRAHARPRVAPPSVRHRRIAPIPPPVGAAPVPTAVRAARASTDQRAAAVQRAAAHHRTAGVAGPGRAAADPGRVAADPGRVAVDRDRAAVAAAAVVVAGDRRTERESRHEEDI